MILAKYKYNEGRARIYNHLKAEDVLLAFYENSGIMAWGIDRVTGSIWTHVGGIKPEYYSDGSLANTIITCEAINGQYETNRFSTRVLDGRTKNVLICRVRGETNARLAHAAAIEMKNTDYGESIILAQWGLSRLGWLMGRDRLKRLAGRLGLDDRMREIAKTHIICSQAELMRVQACSDHRYVNSFPNVENWEVSPADLLEWDVVEKLFIIKGIQ